MVNIAENDIIRKEIQMFYFILLDIMFFPYIFHLPVKLSMIVLIYWMFKKNKIERKMFIRLFLFLFLGIISVCIGLLKAKVSTPVIISDIQTLVIIVYGYIIYEYFKKSIPKYKIDLTNILLIYLGVAAVFMAFYWIKPALFFTIRPFWTLQRIGEVFQSYSQNRFTFLVSEPNNFAATINCIMAYLILSGKLYRNEAIVVAMISFCLIISTSSISGTACYIALLIVFLIINRKKTHPKKPLETGTFRKIFMGVATVVSLGAIVFIIFNIDQVFKTELLISATGRYDLYFTDSNSDVTGGRFDIWITYIKNHNFLEYILVGDASVIRPHSGHLYIIYAFGSLMYCIFMKTFVLDNLKDKQAFIVRVIFMLVFTMNTLIVDLRSFTLWAVLLAATAIKPKDDVTQLSIDDTVAIKSRRSFRRNYNG